MENSFNKIIVDGDTSTNDSVIALANGMLGNNEITLKSSHYGKLERALTDLNSEIAELIVKDGEGSTKVVKLRLKKLEQTRKQGKLLEQLPTPSL